MKEKNMLGLLFFLLLICIGWDVWILAGTEFGDMSVLNLMDFWRVVGWAIYREGVRKGV